MPSFKKKGIIVFIHDVYVCFILKYVFVGSLSKYAFEREKRDYNNRFFEREAGGRVHCHGARMRARKFWNNRPAE